jgi:hypothetical protein
MARTAWLNVSIRTSRNDFSLLTAFSCVNDHLRFTGVGSIKEPAPLNSMNAPRCSVERSKENPRTTLLRDMLTFGEFELPHIIARYQV